MNYHLNDDWEQEQVDDTDGNWKPFTLPAGWMKLDSPTMRLYPARPKEEWAEHTRITLHIRANWKHN